MVLTNVDTTDAKSCLRIKLCWNRQFSTISVVRHEPEVWHFWQVGDLGFANELGNYAEYSGAPNEEETLQFARALIDVSLSKLF